MTWASNRHGELAGKAANTHGQVAIARPPPARQVRCSEAYCQGRLTNVLGERPLSVSPVLLETLITAAADHSSLVKRVAAKALVREMGNLGDSVLPLARRFAQYPSPPVAERGAFILQRLAAGK